MLFDLRNFKNTGFNRCNCSYRSFKWNFIISIIIFVNIRIIFTSRAFNLGLILDAIHHFDEPRTLGTGTSFGVTDLLLRSL